MKFNINKPQRELRKQKKLADKREWHTKIAWLPTSVDETRDTYSRVWFERYWRQGHHAPSRFGRRGTLRFTKYSEKEYFKKKLNGDFDGDSGREESDGMSTGSVSAAQTLGRSLRGDAKPLINIRTDSNTGLIKK